MIKLKKMLTELGLPHDIDEPEASAKMNRIHRQSLDEFTTAYVVAALWSSTTGEEPSGGEPLDKNYDINDIEGQTLKRMIEDCESFQVKARDLYGQGGWSDAQAGHDFWLTRNGHGAGFWDRNWNEKSKEIGKHLTKIAKSYGAFDLYLGDGQYDGLVVGS